jgi:hypothetical protein
MKINKVKATFTGRSPQHIKATAAGHNKNNKIHFLKDEVNFGSSISHFYVISFITYITN